MAPKNERDKQRKEILERRDRLVRAALASVGLATLAGGCNPSSPVCKSIRRGFPSASETVGCGYAGPCLSIAEVPRDSGALGPPPDAGADTAASDDAGDSAAPDARKDGTS